MRYIKCVLVVLLAVFMVSGGAQAANIYKDTYTTEDSSGNWTMDSNLAVGGTLTVTGNSTLSGTVTGKEPVTVLTTATAATVGAVTAAKSGYTFISTAAGDAGEWVLTLPTCADGLVYTFANATTTTVSVQAADTSDTIKYLGIVERTWADTTVPARITSPATVSSVTLVGNTTGDFASSDQDGAWYVVDMTGTWTDSGQ